jgi:hypothetical protein
MSLRLIWLAMASMLNVSSAHQKLGRFLGFLRSEFTSFRSDECESASAVCDGGGWMFGISLNVAWRPSS